MCAHETGASSHAGTVAQRASALFADSSHDFVASRQRTCALILGFAVLGPKW